jgi:hypothetical protein
MGLSAPSPSRLRCACRFGGSATIPLALYVEYKIKT